MLESSSPPSAPRLGFDFSKKQKDFLLAEDSRLNFLEGSIRSGKTHVSLWKWALFVASCPKDYEFIMVGKTLTSLKRNCLTALQKKVGRRNFSFTLSTKEGWLFGRRVWLEGANDERSEGKVQGMTLGGAYCDEVTLYPESFFSMLLGRLSLDGARLYATCNPEYPKHYIKVRYIDNSSLDSCSWHFNLDDNMFLSNSYKENIKKEYLGTVFHKRFILGLWCQAEGVIYPIAATKGETLLIDKIDPASVKYAIIGVDFGGNKSGDSFTLVGITDKGPVILDELYFKGIKTPDILNANFITFCQRNLAKGYKIYEAYVDSAEQTLKAGIEAAVMRARLPIDIRNAKKGPIVDRIRLVNGLMSQGRYKIMRHCTELYGALQQAVWDDKKPKDTRLDDGKTFNVDVLDSMEYALEPVADILIATGG